MSLLNDMLRDLSQQRPVSDGVEGYDHGLLQSSSFAKKKSQSWMPVIIFFVAVFCGVIALQYFFGDRTQKKNSDVESVAKVQPAQMNDTNLVSSQTAPGVTESDSAAIESVDGDSSQQHISDLVQQAERAISMDRLTSPVEDNAYMYYQKILTLDPKNVTAKEGLDRIASRYMVKAQELINSGNTQQAEALIQRARFVSERYVLAHGVSTDNVAVNGFTASAEQAPAEVAKPIAESVKPFVVAEAPVVSVTPNASWKDEQLAQHARALIQEGKQAEALTQLKVFVASEKAPVQSAAALIDLYIQQEKTDAADIVLKNATYLPVDVSAKFKAQLLNIAGEDAQAIALLEKHLAEAESNEAYRSMLAGLYHKTANYQQSLLSYQRLINSFGDKPAYWLGIALAYDGLMQPKNALQAYIHLQEFPQLQEQVKKYTDQRIAALSGK